MNRAIIHAGDEITPAMLPPERGSASGPLRVLFVGVKALGFKTTASLLERFAGEREDLDAVHWYPKLSFFERVMAAPTPMDRLRPGWRGVRQYAANARCVGRTLGARGPGGIALERFDIIHFQTQQWAGWLRGRKGRLRCKAVTQADATVRVYARTFGMPTHGLEAVEACERATVQAADAVCCWTRWAADSMRDDLGVPGSRLLLYRPTPVSSRREGAGRKPGEKLRIIFVGNDWERKGGHRLLRWHQQRWTESAELHICSAKAPIDPSAKSVVWHGATPHDRLIREILPNMHVLVMPTSNDTYMIAAAEAQIAGLPVISSRLAGIPEVVRDGVSGILCDPASDEEFIAAVERVMNRPDELERLSHGAVEHARRELDPAVWHEHLFRQFFRLHRGEAVEFAPAGTEDSRPRRSAGSEVST